MRLLGLLFLIAIILLGMTFSALNSSDVMVNYYFGEREIALSFLLVVVFTAGAILGVLSSMWLMIKLKVNNHRLRHQVLLYEREMDHLKKIPFRDTI